MLKCLIVPLLVSSITSAIGSLDLSMSGKIATRYKQIYISYNKLKINFFLILRAILYYFITTISAVILGIMLVTTIQPGKVGRIDEFITEDVERNSKVLTPDTLMDLIRYKYTLI